jgi:hypothetical protein
MPLLRGAFPSPRHRLAGATPHRVVAAPPEQFLWKPKKLNMWGNDVDGDCVTAEECFAKATHSPEIFIPYAQAVEWARTYGFLNGATLIDVLDKMQTGPFVQGKTAYFDGPPNSVDWTNATVLQSAISQGPVKIGVAADQLETVCNAVSGFPANGWLATGFQPDRDEDHCVSLCGYGTIAWLASELGATVASTVDTSAAAYALFTWSSIGIIDGPSMLAITAEAWLRNPTTIVKPAL